MDCYLQDELNQQKSTMQEVINQEVRNSIVKEWSVLSHRTSRLMFNWRHQKQLSSPD